MRLLFIVLFLTPSIALAQQPQMSPSEQAMASKMMEEIRANIGLRAQVIQLQEQVKELEAKQVKPDAKQK